MYAVTAVVAASTFMKSVADGVGAQAAQHAGAEHFGGKGGDDGDNVVVALTQRHVDEAAAERAYHASGEGHERTDAQQVADEAGAEGHEYAPAGAEEHGAQHVYHVLPWASSLLPRKGNWIKALPTTATATSMAERASFLVKIEDAL